MPQYHLDILKREGLIGFTDCFTIPIAEDEGNKYDYYDCAHVEHENGNGNAYNCTPASGPENNSGICKKYDADADVNVLDELKRDGLFIGSKEDKSSRVREKGRGAICEYVYRTRPLFFRHENVVPDGSLTETMGSKKPTSPYVYHKYKNYIIKVIFGASEFNACAITYLSELCWRIPKVSDIFIILHQHKYLIVQIFDLKTDTYATDNVDDITNDFYYDDEQTGIFFSEYFKAIIDLTTVNFAYKCVDAQSNVSELNLNRFYYDRNSHKIYFVEVFDEYVDTNEKIKSMLEKCFVNAIDENMLPNILYNVFVMLGKLRPDVNLLEIAKDNLEKLIGYHGLNQEIYESVSLVVDEDIRKIDESEERVEG